MIERPFVIPLNPNQRLIAIVEALPRFLSPITRRLVEREVDRLERIDAANEALAVAWRWEIEAACRHINEGFSSGRACREARKRLLTESA